MLQSHSKVMDIYNYLTEEGKDLEQQEVAKIPIPIMISYKCTNCKEGEMIYDKISNISANEIGDLSAQMLSGFNQPDLSKSYLHVCNKCHLMFMIPKIYPHVIYHMPKYPDGSFMDELDKELFDEYRSREYDENRNKDDEDEEDEEYDDE